MTPEERQLLANALNQVQVTDAPHSRLTVYDLWAMPETERQRVMAEAVAKAIDENFELFEANVLYEYDDESKLNA